MSNAKEATPPNAITLSLHTPTERAPASKRSSRSTAGKTQNPLEEALPASPSAVTPAPSEGEITQSVGRRHASPKVIEKPQYTKRALAKSIEGDVVLCVHVDKNGQVQSASVKQKLGFGLDESAIQAILRSTFEPALDENGNPIEEEVDYRFKFVLHNAA